MAKPRFCLGLAARFGGVVPPDDRKGASQRSFIGTLAKVAVGVAIAKARAARALA